MSTRDDDLVKRAIKTPEFYEEMLLLSAQELIAQLMKDQNMAKADLARKMKKSKAHITSILSDGRNLTLKSLANICFQMGAEVKLQASLLSANSMKSESTYQNEKGVAQVATPPTSNPSELLH